jgi:SAM-dependent MidA family methyltransferase
MVSTASTALQQLIIERIQRERIITFAEYMRMALYEPNYGYYVTGPARIGWEEGDYFTNANLSVFFANCMARQLHQWWEKLGRPAPFVVLEQGAERGKLAQGVRNWAIQQASNFGAALEYRVEDILTGQDVQAIGEEDQQAIEPPSVIVSNELVDAFPVHIVEIRRGELYELYVLVQDGRLVATLAEPFSDEVASYLDTYNVPWRQFGDGWRAEINLDALRWMRRTAQLLRKGFLLTVDYGDKAKGLYTRDRRHGTLACYSRHHINDQPLARPGEQDITAHVNFSALIDEGRRQGLRLNQFTTQRLWLKSLGIDEELERLRATEFAEADTERASDRGQIALFQWKNVRQHVAALTDPAGMGNFKVMVLRR